MPPKPMLLSARFWRHVEKTESCWMWQGHRVKAGYGKFMVGGIGAWAHRVAWQLTNGPIPDGMCVCHTCDVRQCVRPSHLFLGTHRDNIADCIAKRRKAIGERCATAKLTGVAVAEIRRLTADGVRQKDIADLFGVAQTTVSAIQRGVTWRHTLS